MLFRLMRDRFGDFLKFFSILRKQFRAFFMAGVNSPVNPMEEFLGLTEDV